MKDDDYRECHFCDKDLGDNWQVCRHCGKKQPKGAGAKDDKPKKTPTGEWIYKEGFPRERVNTQHMRPDGKGKVSYPQCEFTFPDATGKPRPCHFAGTSGPIGELSERIIASRRTKKGVEDLHDSGPMYCWVHSQILRSHNEELLSGITGKALHDWLDDGENRAALDAKTIYIEPTITDRDYLERKRGYRDHLTERSKFLQHWSDQCDKTRQSPDKGPTSLIKRVVRNLADLLTSQLSQRKAKDRRDLAQDLPDDKPPI